VPVPDRGGGGGEGGGEGRTTREQICLRPAEVVCMVTASTAPGRTWAPSATAAWSKAARSLSGCICHDTHVHEVCHTCG